MGVLRRLWAGWKIIAHKIGTVQARFVLGVVYLVVVGPVALVRRLGQDPLELRPSPEPTYWRERPPVEPSLAAARRQ